MFLPTIGRSSPLNGLKADLKVTSSKFKDLASSTFNAFDKVIWQLSVDVLEIINLFKIWYYGPTTFLTLRKEMLIRYKLLPIIKTNRMYLRAHSNLIPRNWTYYTSNTGAVNSILQLLGLIALRYNTIFICWYFELPFSIKKYLNCLFLT